MKRNIYILSALIGCFLWMTACTDKFEEYNTPKVGISDKGLEQDFNHIGAYFLPVQEMIYVNYNWGDGTDWTFQLTQNLTADLWSGYMASATPFGGNVNNQTYSIGWNDFAWDYTYAHMMSNVQTIRAKCAEGEQGEYDHFKAVLDILTVMGMHRISDMYGPIIYTKYGDAGYGGNYDSQKDAYYAFFDNLASSVNILNKYMSDNPGAAPFKRFDKSFNGDYAKWIKVANTLRLRLAMRISKVDPAKAKTEAEAAVAAGVMQSNDDNYFVKNFRNPLAITTSWGDIQLSANMESILGGYNDPRLKVYATPSTHPEAKGEIKGMRMGIPGLDDNTTGIYKQYSFVNVDVNDPVQLMTAAEAYFLRAEGALRGWNMGGTAKDLYETGVKTSFDQHGAALGEYLTSSALPKNYVDFVQPLVVSGPAESRISPNWDDASSNEERLEKIITQKWIAGFPEGYEAWAELRRTGYPKLFKVLKNDSGGRISTETGIRRHRFSQAERTANEAGVNSAIQLLEQGGDEFATRVWWDVDKGNF